MLVWVPEPVCHTTRGKWSSSLPSITSCAARAITSARRASSRPSSRFTSAAARLTMASARMIGCGMRSSPIRKLRRERSVCAPHHRLAATSIGPNVSVSVRVFMRSQTTEDAGQTTESRHSCLFCPLSTVVRPLLLTETIEANDLPAAGRLVRPLVGGPGRRVGRLRNCGDRRRGGRSLVLCRRSRHRAHAGRGGAALRRIRDRLGKFLELENELHGGIEKSLDGGERNDEPLGDAPERNADLETVVLDHEVPELVLKDDSHFLGKLSRDPRRHAHAMRAGIEGDVEMVLARQTVFGGVVENGAHDAAKRFAREDVVTDMIDGHDRSPAPDSV